MKLFKTLVLAFALYPLGANADPVTPGNNDPAAILVSLNPHVIAGGSEKMTKVPDGRLEELLGKPAKKPKPVQIAGRCGSSNYSCTSPGFLYCCGNAQDGFYCAPDVNGC